MRETGRQLQFAIDVPVHGGGATGEVLPFVQPVGVTFESQLRSEHVIPHRFGRCHRHVLAKMDDFKEESLHLHLLALDWVVLVKFCFLFQHAQL